MTTLTIVVYEIIDCLDIPSLPDVDKPFQAKAGLSIDEEVDSHSSPGLDHSDLTIRSRYQLTSNLIEDVMKC